MRPWSGRRRPAKHWSVSVLPAPLGPKRATTWSPDSQQTSSANPGRRLAMERETISASPAGQRPARDGPAQDQAARVNLPAHPEGGGAGGRSEERRGGKEG